jgi:GH24 family phage-related lysozyme (muramidase)
MEKDTEGLDLVTMTKKEVSEMKLKAYSDGVSSLTGDQLLELVPFLMGHFKYGRKTAYRRIKSNRYPQAIKEGRSWLISKAEVDKLTNKNE